MQLLPDIFLRLKSALAELGSVVLPGPMAYTKQDRENIEINVLSYVETTTTK